MSRPKPTQFIPAPKLSADLACELTLISELQQHTHSFKFRAAWNVVQRIDASHFLAASSGNFGQALAKAAQLSQRQCTIVMPTTSAHVKIEAVRSYGAEVVFVDTALQTRASKVAQVLEQYPTAHVASAYDCPWVIEGNASLGFEIAQSNIPFDVIVAPVGGGGLSAGIIQGLCQSGSRISVWGAEPLMANDGARSLKTGELYRHELEPQTLADGARTASLGQLNFQILKTGMVGMIEVSEADIIWGLQRLAEEGLRVEPTGALSVGALRRHVDFEGLRIGCVLSGGNVDEGLYQALLRKPALI